MKNYIAPEMEVNKFNLSDILTASGLTELAPITEENAIQSDNGVTYISDFE